MQQEKAWWNKRRIHSELFAAELEAALRLLALLPATGSIYTKVSIAGLRRWYLPKIGCHLYYTFDENTVIIRALWGARRRRGPLIKS